MSKLINLPSHIVQSGLYFGVASDFEQFVSGDEFTDTSADSGAAVTNVDAVGGQVKLSSIAIDNNEVSLLGTKEIFLFAAGKPIFAKCILAYAEGNTDDINVAFGLSDAVGANQLVDNGAGLKTSFSGAAFYKVDGGTLWNTCVSLGATQATKLLNATNSLDKTAHTGASGATTFQTLEIECLPYSSTNQWVNFRINGVHVWQEDMVFTSATEMQVFVSLKLGGATVENVYIDYLGAWQKR